MAIPVPTRGKNRWCPRSDRCLLLLRLQDVRHVQLMGSCGRWGLLRKAFVKSLALDCAAAAVPVPRLRFGAAGKPSSVRVATWPRPTGWHDVLQRGRQPRRVPAPTVVSGLLGTGVTHGRFPTVAGEPEERKKTDPFARCAHRSGPRAKALDHRATEVTPDPRSC